MKTHVVLQCMKKYVRNLSPPKKKDCRKISIKAFPQNCFFLLVEKCVFKIEPTQFLVVVPKKKKQPKTNPIHLSIKKLMYIQKNPQFESKQPPKIVFFCWLII